ncbi:uncharacterized protein MONOS_1766 [Monocercomonoides exilis]|uniref:uncharacterized protein n=1 Tax=Monocercomonoides exilis TaxID=2049356 RepID=UPI003559E77B|nr:hypothetical protein MONOS_1766 [Monocercomonoides exilis]|eukprot:MONOS_1766.1-p1 / transcript=MONOS_1766.1 / gene=MONOS_1766 / organism=Monocercomonoides_exilis_PA203 / gene_product=unspecified product / transcript_product=unspecified product / location=Mono_scaffold00033:1774-2399(-) / protein_length=189 / sequence_SO=supercontig / SO=protein_coding / is_pseudo=false
MKKHYTKYFRVPLTEALHFRQEADDFDFIEQFDRVNVLLLHTKNDFRGDIVPGITKVIFVIDVSITTSISASLLPLAGFVAATSVPLSGATIFEAFTASTTNVVIEKVPCISIEMALLGEPQLCKAPSSVLHGFSVVPQPFASAPLSLTNMASFAFSMSWGRCCEEDEEVITDCVDAELSEEECEDKN